MRKGGGRSWQVSSIWALFGTYMFAFRAFQEDKQLEAQLETRKGIL